MDPQASTGESASLVCQTEICPSPNVSTGVQGRVDLLGEDNQGGPELSQLRHPQPDPVEAVKAVGAAIEDVSGS